MADFGEFGTTGLKQYGGRIHEEIERDLQGTRWHKAVRGMLNDGVIGAMLFAIEMLMRQVEWNITPADETPQAQEYAEFVESCLQDMSLSWEDTMGEILTMLPWGFAPLEITYKRRMGTSRDPKRNSRFDDGRIGWRKWAIRAQDTVDRWQFDERGGIQGVWQFRDSGAPVFIPIDKTLLFRTTAHKGNPEGRSILRNAWQSFYFRRHIENIEGIGIERDLAGLPVIYAPPEIMSQTASDAEKYRFQMLKDIVSNIRRDEQEGIVMPMAYNEAGKLMYDLKLLSTGGQRQFDTGAIVQRYDRRILMTVLADIIFLGHESVGSFALSATKSSMFRTALEAWLHSIADVINRYAIDRLMKLNGFDAKLSPQFVFGRVGDIELEDIVNFVEKMSKAGMQMFPSVELENHLRNESGLPMLTEEEIEERERQREAEPVPPPEPPTETPPDSAEMAAWIKAAQRVVSRG